MRSVSRPLTTATVSPATSPAFTGAAEMESRRATSLAREVPDWASAGVAAHASSVSAAAILMLFIARMYLFVRLPADPHFGDTQRKYHGAQADGQRRHCGRVTRCRHSIFHRAWAETRRASHDRG